MKALIRIAAILAWAALLGAVPMVRNNSPRVPAINKYSDVNAGSILAGAIAGTLILNSPSGTRTATAGASLGTSVGEVLGSLSLTGEAGDAWAIANGSAIPFSLYRVGGGILTVTAVDFELSNQNTGSFPASKTTPMFYLGVTIAVASSASTPQGTYTGSFLLRVTDTTLGTSSTTAFNVTARVDPVISLTATGGLAFGDVFAGPVAGTVVLAPDGSRIASPGIVLGGGSPSGPATLTVQGAPNATYAIMLPARITLQGPNGSMVVSPFTADPGPSGLLSECGAQQVSVGATLNLAVNQPDGTYTGVFALSVAYN
jgi:hypothetical protein